MSEQQRKGVIAGLACYAIWGMFPLYWHMLAEVNSFEIICHRIIWCTVFTLIFCAVLRFDPRSMLRDRRVLVHLVPAAIICTANWTIYVVGVNTGHTVECAIGYYINPLVSILLGMVCFRERLTPIQMVATLLCCAGIIYFTWDYGQFPWIAIGLALTMGVYGAIKKHGNYPAVEALTIENIAMFVPAILCAIGLAIGTGAHGFLGDTATLHGWTITGLLALGGLVTAIPLILFAKAANDIPLSLLGFIQYVSPTLQLLCGVALLGEAFTTAHAICLGLIWTGLILVSAETVIKSRRQPQP